MKYLLFAGLLFAMFRLLWWGEMFWRKANAEMTETPIRTRILATVAGVLGVVIHIEGLPFGRRGFFDTVPSGVMLRRKSSK